MRIWSIHPQHLDAKGLVALWREVLLALHVLQGKTNGYRNHPQLLRFKNYSSPEEAINFYLSVVFGVASERGYHFDRGKLSEIKPLPQIPVTSGQLDYEWQHLLKKLKTRDPEFYKNNILLLQPRLHPLFFKIEGPVETWEKVL